MELSKRHTLFLEALEHNGNLELSRSYSGLSKEQAALVPEEAVRAAIAAHDQGRIKDYKKIMQRAKEMALITDDVGDMLAVAQIMAPELAVYPVERQRARAKADYAQPPMAVQINVGLTDLAERLQKALKEHTP